MTEVYLTREQVRRVDQVAIERIGVPGLVLMENAGRGCTDALEGWGIAGPVLICCGKGNNGGDGFVIARHLHVRGYTPRVIVAGTEADLHGDAMTNCQILRRLPIELHFLGSTPPTAATEGLFDQADWIVDALLGTGARGNPRSPCDAIIQRANAAPGRKLAIDLPSGLDCDTGQPGRPTFRADHTCTLVAAKVGFREPTAATYLGQVHVVDIGVPPAIGGSEGSG